MNKKGISTLAITGIVIAVIIVISLLFFVGSYNSLITLDENVDEKWANVQTAYQRRADLIPNLVETVQGVVDFEKETQTQIAAVRSQAVSAKKAMQNAGSVEELQKAAAKSEQAVSAFKGLNINVERYPNLKANENFLSLQDELAGTENRIKVERDLFNKAVKNYNIKVRKFPTNIIAGMFGFENKDMFESDEGSEEAVEVNFE
ncbi:MAG: LemA family protein [Nanobdellota archaeon]